MHSSHFVALIILPIWLGLLLVSGCSITSYNSMNKQKRIVKCCKGYTTLISKNSYKCVPICKFRCDNGNCAKPNVCRCLKGYDNIQRDPTQSCVPLCLMGCQNGRCVAPNRCECDAGYQLNEHGNGCEPLDAGGPSNNISTSVCPNGCAEDRICVAPNTCNCREDYMELFHLCLPTTADLMKIFIWHYEIQIILVMLALLMLLWLLYYCTLWNFRWRAIFRTSRLSSASSTHSDAEYIEMSDERLNQT